VTTLRGTALEEFFESNSPQTLVMELSEKPLDILNMKNSKKSQWRFRNKKTEEVRVDSRIKRHITGSITLTTPGVLSKSPLISKPEEDALNTMLTEEIAKLGGASFFADVDCSELDDNVNANDEYAHIDEDVPNEYTMYKDTVLTDEKSIFGIREDDNCSQGELDEEGHEDDDVNENKDDAYPRDHDDDFHKAESKSELLACEGDDIRMRDNGVNVDKDDVEV
jgi:hypothetical protein